MSPVLTTTQTIFIILLTVQATVADAEPLPSLGMPTNAQAYHDAANGVIEVTWERPADADASAVLTYEVHRNNILVYSGASRSYVDPDVDAVVAYTITARDGTARSAPAIAVANPLNIDTSYPHCLNIIIFTPLPQVNWDCLFPIP